MHEDRFAFNRRAIRPLECLSGAWQLIKQDYWLFLGISFVGFLIAELASFILVGPAMCGIHICLLRQANGRRVTFDMLFQGFNYFTQSLIATLIMMAPISVVGAIYLVGYFGGLFGFAAMMGQQQQAGEQPDAMVGLYFFAGMMGWTFAFIFFAVLVQMFFFFVFPLIVDRELTGVEAVRVSFRAVLANFGGVLMVTLLEMLLGVLGEMACCVGLILVMPIAYAMITIAYQQVFPPIDPYADMPLEPEPPAPLVLEEATAVQVKAPRVTSVQDTPPGASGQRTEPE